MNISFPGSVLLSSQIADIFNDTVTSSLRHAELTVAGPLLLARNKEGCLILRGTNLNPTRNSETIVSGKIQTLVLTIAGAFITLLFLVGFPCNLLSAAVFYKQGLKERINLCVFCLAIVDIGTVSVPSFIQFETFYKYYVGPLDVFVKYFSGFNGFTWVSMFLTCVIAAERCFCVVSPLRVQRILSTRTTAIIIITVSLILMAGMAANTGPRRKWECLFDAMTNKTINIVILSEYYYKNKKILDPLDIFVYGIIIPCIAFIFVLVTTIITVNQLRSALDWRRKSSSASATQHAGSLENHAVSLTRMLIATSVLFVVCLSPSLVMQMSVYFVSDLRHSGRYSNIASIIWGLIYLLRCINSSLNFFIYYKMGSRFRHTLKQLLCCGGGNKDVSSS